MAKLGSLEIWIYTRDHKPAHVHVTGPDVNVKIEISSWVVVYAEGLNAKSMRKLVDFLKSIEKDLREAWNEIHE